MGDIENKKNDGMKNKTKQQQKSITWFIHRKQNIINNNEWQKAKIPQMAITFLEEGKREAE